MEPQQIRSCMVDIIDREAQTWQHFEEVRQLHMRLQKNHSNSQMIEGSGKRRISTSQGPSMERLSKLRKPGHSMGTFSDHICNFQLTSKQLIEDLDS